MSLRRFGLIVDGALNFHEKATVTIIDGGKMGGGRGLSVGDLVNVAKRSERF